MGEHESNGLTALRKAASKRMGDAEALLWMRTPRAQDPQSLRRVRKRRSAIAVDSAHGRGAMYLAGYAVECMLKAIAMEIHDCWTLDALAAKWGVDERVVYTHGLECFFKRLPLWRRFTQSGSVWHDFASQVNTWRPSWRYRPDHVPIRKAERFVEAVRSVLNWLSMNKG